MTKQRPDSFPMAIQGGMLEALGINMYSTLGKCLVEFAANSYDSNAPSVEIVIPFEDIDTARRGIKASLKAAKKGNDPTSQLGVDSTQTISTPDLSMFKATLDESIFISIKDHGHGMSPDDVINKFLPINRHRRADATGAETQLKSEGGQRAVMGRKGLGKLAGFGIADKVVVETKRKGDTFKTTFTLDAASLARAENLSNIQIPAVYFDGQDVNSSGTKITLRCLKPDALRSSREKIIETIAEAFYGIETEDFAIRLNSVLIQSPTPQYDFVFPDLAAQTGQPIDDFVHIPDIGTLPIKYVVKFRKSGEHLPAGKRGARIYCNKRLAAGPSLFKLGTGMHNFHGQDYLECIVIADKLDQLGVDFVNTNRSQLREDNDVVDAVLNHVSELMRKALKAHSTYKEEKVEADIDNSPQGKLLKSIIEQLPRRSRAPTAKLLHSIALRHGTDSVEFSELAPLVVQSVNAGETLIKLIELQADPGTIARVAAELKELAKIERSDSLKIYRGKKNGITGLRTLIERGKGLWQQKGIEAELHALFKQNPWLIKPEYFSHLTSDEDLNKLASKIAKILEVDKFSKIHNENGKPDLTRPDLTFVMADSTMPYIFNVVELKSPSLPLDYNHLTQLKRYIRKIEDFIRVELKTKTIVKGYLIGAMPEADTRNEDQLQLLDEINKRSLNDTWEVLGLEQVLARSHQIHSEAIKAFEADEMEQIEVAPYLK
jgi:hypothetical protein